MSIDPNHTKMGTMRGILAKLYEFPIDGIGLMIDFFTNPHVLQTIWRGCRRCAPHCRMFHEYIPG